jgi:hypothetical protein
MRRFTDNGEQEWEIAVGRASWGVFLALFVPRDGGAVREVPLPYGSAEDANRGILEASRVELQSLLDRSGPRTE